MCPRDTKTVNNPSASKSADTWAGAYWRYGVWLAIAMTFVAYIPVFEADFVNWDDQEYVTNNKLIRSFSPFSKFFLEPVAGNYHPLTMISLALNHAVSGEDATSYHVLNLVLHLINVWLVFRLVLKLMPTGAAVAFGSSLLFGVHPMHVESVAWVSERKDVLYSLFFLWGLIQYLAYIDTGSRKRLAYTFVLFVFSILSKPAAIIFPAVLFVFDYYRRRQLSVGLFLEKSAFVIVAAVFVYLTLYAQSSAGATDTLSQFDLNKRIFFPFYGSMMYLYKLVLPIHLTPFYPFPAINKELGLEYKLAPLLFLAIAWLCWKTWRRHRELTFGFGFYYLNLAMVLQFFIVGSAVIAERYTYIPYIGLFFIAGWLLSDYFKMSGKYIVLVYLLTGTVFTYMSYRQAQTWKSTETLWDGAIRSHPGARAYANRAYLYQQKGEWEKALDYYTRSLKYNVIDPEVYTNMGVIYYNQGKDSLSMAHYNKALDLRPNFVNALNGRGSLLAKQGKYALAIKDFDKSIELKPTYELAYKNRAAAHFMLMNYEAAVKDYLSYTELWPTDFEGYSNLGVAYMRMGKNEEAIRACQKALAMDSTFAKAYTNLGAAYINLKQYDTAIPILQKSMSMDSTNEETFKFLSLAYISKGDTAKAMAIFHLAQQRKR